MLKLFLNNYRNLCISDIVDILFWLFILSSYGLFILSYGYLY